MWLQSTGGEFTRGFARDCNGTTQYLSALSAYALDPNGARTIGGIFRVDSFAAQRVLLAIGIPAGTSRVFLSTAITTGNVTLTTTATAGSSSSASSTGVAAGTWALYYGIAYEGNTGRESGCNRLARGTEGTTQSITATPTLITIGATLTGSAPLDGACYNAWAVRGVLSPWQTDRLADFAHITTVVNRSQIIESFTCDRQGIIPGEIRRSHAQAIGGGALVLGPIAQRPPSVRRAWVGYSPAAAGNPWYAYARMRG